MMSLRSICLDLTLICSAATLASAAQILPTPQYNEPLKESVLIAPGGRVGIVLGPAKAAGNKKLRLAADFLRRDLEAADSSLRVEVEAGSIPNSAGPHICLWDYSVDRNPAAG